MNVCVCVRACVNTWQMFVCVCVCECTCYVIHGNNIQDCAELWLIIKNTKSKRSDFVTNKFKCSSDYVIMRTDTIYHQI